MKIPELLLPLTLLTLNGRAQTPSWIWARSGVGLEFDHCNTVATDASGNVIAAGYFSSDSIGFGGITLQNNTPGFSDLFIVKYDPAGAVLWAKGLGGDFDDEAYSVATDAGGNILLAANFASTTITVGSQTFTNAGSPGDILLVKYDPAGNVLWATREGGPALEIPHAVTFDDAGNFIVAGRFSSNSITFGTTTLLQAGSMDVFVVKYDPSGNVLWAQGAGGGSNDEAYAVAVDGAGDIIVAGYFTQEADFGSITLPNPGLANIFLAQCDATTGSFQWAKAIASDGDERALAIALDAADNIYAAGFFQGDSLVFGATTLYSTSTDNGYVARFDSDGDPVWAHGLDGRSKAQGIAVANNAVYACGVFRNDSLNYGPYLLQLEGSSDLFLLKSDLNGNVQWAAKQTADGESSESATAMTADLSGDLVITGDFNSDVTTFGTAQLINSNGFDAFVVKTGDPDVGIMDATATAAITISPNPSRGTFVIDAVRNVESVEVRNAMGAVVHALTVRGSRARIEVNVPGLPPGLYHVLLTAHTRSMTGKMVIE